MGRPRKTALSLALSRIYIRHGKFVYYGREPILNSKTGRSTRWHVLCPTTEGELRARLILDKLLKRQNPGHGSGNFGPKFRTWQQKILKQRERKAPRDSERIKIWQRGTKNLLSVYGVIEKAFADFDLDQIRPSDIAEFLDQWEGRRSAGAYRSHLSKFFAWCCRTGSLTINPVREVEVEEPPERTVYITPEIFVAIRNALLKGDDGKPTRTGEMVQCYMDLLYLLFQRGTEIRLLRWDQIGERGIVFKPTKTERSSGKQVLVPLTEPVMEVLGRARSLGKTRSDYVIHTEHGHPYTASGIASLFKRACARIGVKDVTLKDIRAMAATDAAEKGFDDAQIQVALAHTDVKATQHYIRRRQVPVSVVTLTLPTEDISQTANIPPSRRRGSKRK